MRRLSSRSASLMKEAIDVESCSTFACVNTSLMWNVRLRRMMLSARSNESGACSAERRKRNSSPSFCLPVWASGDEKQRCSEQHDQILIGALPLWNDQFSSP